MEAKELRIGSLFYDEDKTPCYYAGCWERSDGWIYRDSGNNTYSEVQMFPIPLTPEILEKAGFVKVNDDAWRIVFTGFDKNTLDIEDDGSVGIGDLGGMEEGHWFCTKENVCKYVHQLQNLYYALTNTELEITL